MYGKPLFFGGAGAAAIGASGIGHAETEAATHAHGGLEHVTVFVREAFVQFPGHGPTFWILNILAIIVGINTIAYATLAMWKMRPRRSEPMIDPMYENYTPYGEPVGAN